MQDGFNNKTAMCVFVRILIEIYVCDLKKVFIYTG